ncbi:hypothetical protein JMJ77_0007513, partial [Colletotrichum scovillei]
FSEEHLESGSLPTSKPPKTGGPLLRIRRRKPHQQHCRPLGRTGRV